MKTNKNNFISILITLFIILNTTAISYSQTAEELEQQLQQQQRENQDNVNTGQTNNQQSQQQQISVQTQGSAPVVDSSWTESFSLAFGVEMAYGNSRSTVGTYEARYSTAHGEGWDFNFSLEGAYGESRDSSTGSMAKDRSEHNLKGVFDRWFLNKLIAASYNVTLLTNEFANVYLRWTNGLALKIKPINVWWLELTFTFSPSVEYTKTYDLRTRKTEWAMVYTVELNINFDKKQTVTLTNSFTFTPKFLDYHDNRINFTSNFTVKFLKIYTITIGFTYDYVSEPPNQYTHVQKSDYRLSTKLGIRL